MQTGCYTAIITPFKNGSVDYDGLKKLVDFQVENGITGIVAVGTTGESPTLTWDEHNRVIQKVAADTKNKALCIAGTGSNNTAEALEGTRNAVKAGVDAVLLVDPYYNGPSSLEIRREYVEPVARAFPQIQVIPYVIPGRTGAQLLPEDLAMLAEKFTNVRSVKEATGDLNNMRRTRTCCGAEYTILSGDDGLTFAMMTDPGIAAAGVISVVTNIAPGAVAKMVSLLNQGEVSRAKQLAEALKPLFDLVTVKTVEKTAYGEVACKARNPLPIKTAMQILGLPSGGCRKPLGKMTQNGLDRVVSALRRVYSDNPEILQPAAEFFNIDLDQRLNDTGRFSDLIYEGY